MEPEMIHLALKDQFKRVLHMFKSAVMKLPAEQWRTGASPDRRPAGLACHLLETIEFYISDLPSEKFPWGHRFGMDWEVEDPTQLPSQAQLQEHFSELEQKLAGWLAVTDFLTPETVFKWTGRTVLERALYLLRHTQHHVGELSRELDTRGLSGPEWR